MARERQYQVDFLAVRIKGPNQHQFGEMVRRVVENQTSAVEFRDDYVQLQHASVSGQICLGVFTRVRMWDLPRIVKLSGSDSELQLGEDEGVGSDAFFLYDLDRRVLLMTRNRSSVGPHAFAFYFERRLAEVELELEYILTEDAYERLQRAQIIRGIEFGLARPSHGEAYHVEWTGRSVASLLKLTEEVAAATVVVELRFGPGKGSLNVPAAKRLVEHLWNLYNHDPLSVRKLRVTGKSLEDEDLEPIDLIQDRLTDRISVPLIGRYASRQSAWEQLRQLYAKHERHLRRFG